MLRYKPTVVQAWMYHACVFGGVVAYLLRVRKIVWTVVASDLTVGIKRRTRWFLEMSVFLARVIPDRIVYCADLAKDIHIKLGYPRSNAVTIPIGFDMDDVSRVEVAYCDVRDELGLPKDARIIGLVARFDPLKDHENFFKAAALAAGQDPNLYFVCCGKDVDWQNAKITPWIKKTIRDRFRLLGLRTDVVRLMSAFDVATLSSYSEAFPLVVGEAMACQTPVVSTNVGDVEKIIGDCGTIVPPRNAEALAAGWLRMLSLSERERQALGKRSADRVREMFSIDRILRLYHQEWLSASAK